MSSSFLPILLIFFVGAITAQPLNATEVAQIVIGKLNQAVLNKDNNSLYELFDESFELEYYGRFFRNDKLFKLFIDVPLEIIWDLNIRGVTTEQDRIRFLSSGCLKDLTPADTRNRHPDYVEFFMNITTKKVFFAKTVDYWVWIDHKPRSQFKDWET